MLTASRRAGADYADIKSLVRATRNWNLHQGTALLRGRGWLRSLGLLWAEGPRVHIVFPDMAMLFSCAMQASAVLVFGFWALAWAMAAAFVVGVYVALRRAGDPRVGARTWVAAIASIAWLLATYALAHAGALSFTARPPTMLFLLAAVFVLAFAIGLSRLGQHLALQLPLWLLVGFQSFRIIVELLMHRAYEEGLMPVQMSYSGRNFDIVSGITALTLGVVLLLRPVPRWLVYAWNVLGMALLANILAVALLSAPLPIRTFHNEPANVWVTQAPWVWLPAVMVLAAILGHILMLRRLKARRS
jgi:hypothetical protein